MFARNNGHGHRSVVGVGGIKISRKVAFATAYGLLGVLALVGSDISLGSVSMLARQLNLATECIDNIYVESAEDAVLMPPVPEEGLLHVPTSIAMCYEWIRRDALSIEDGIMQRINIFEHRDVCLDWSAPHYNMMEIIASSILNTVLTRVRYRHACPDHREYEEAMRGYDWSTVQTVFQEPAMAVNQDLVLPQRFKDVCKACLEGYDKDTENYRVKSRSFGHCFALPEDSTMYNTPLTLSEVTENTVLPLPSQPNLEGNIAPISAIADVLRTRLWHSAAEWNNVTDHPPNEFFKGTVILIDTGSYAVDPSVYMDFIAPDTDSISIISGPLCYTANLPTGEKCMEYGNSLKDYFTNQFPPPDNGVEGGPVVDFQISASTAGTYSRAILAKDLICPPATVSCLLPAMGKKSPTKAQIMECTPPCPGTSAPFFDKVGTNDGITECILLPSGKVPPPLVTDPDPATVPVIPTPPEGVPLAPQFAEAQAPIAGDAFDSDQGPPPPSVDVDEVAAKPSDLVYKGVEPQLPPEIGDHSFGDPNEMSPLNVLPNVLIDYSNTEHIPTPGEIDAAVANDEPLDANTPEIPESETYDAPLGIVSSELATDESTNLISREMTDENFMEMAVARRNSKERIVTGYDGNYLFEVPCPSADDVGGVLVVDEGYAITDNGDTVIISDGTGTVTFKSPVIITTIPIVRGNLTDPVTGATEETEYFTIIDPVLQEPVNVTAAGITLHPDSSLEVTNPVGTLVTDPVTQHGVLITMGKAKKLKYNKKNLESNPAHAFIEGTVESCGDESIPPDESGTVVMKEDGSLAVTAQSETFNGFLDVDPQEGNTGDYTQLLPSELESSVTAMSTYDNCKHTDFAKPIQIVPETQTGDFVMVEVFQTFKGEEISWVAIDAKNALGEQSCIKHEEVPFGSIEKHVLSCTEGTAVMDIYIHDGSKIINQAADYDSPLYDITSQIPERCEPSEDYGNKCYFKYAIDCTGEVPARRLNEGAKGRRMLKGQHSLWGQSAKEKPPQHHPAMTPKHVVVPPATKELKQLKFAQNIVRRCPELGKEKIFDHFYFGGKAPAKKILVPSQVSPSGSVTIVR